MDDSSKRRRRLVFIITGVTDALIGAALLFIGFGILPVNIGLPNWVVILIGGGMAVIGATVAIYNFSRLDE